MQWTDTKIDQKVNELFGIYNNGKTIQEEVKTKLCNIGKQNSYFKYNMFFKDTKHDKN